MSERLDEIKTWVDEFPTVYRSDRMVHIHVDWLIVEIERLNRRLAQIYELAVNGTTPALALVAIREALAEEQS